MARAATCEGVAAVMNADGMKKTEIGRTPIKTSERKHHAEVAQHGPR
jgi:hypothetical protein